MKSNFLSVKGQDLTFKHEDEKEFRAGDYRNIHVQEQSNQGLVQSGYLLKAMFQYVSLSPFHTMHLHGLFLVTMSYSGFTTFYSFLEASL